MLAPIISNEPSPDTPVLETRLEATPLPLRWSRVAVGSGQRDWRPDDRIPWRGRLQVSYY